MGYPRMLDDYTDEELRAELDRRRRAREIGLCDYCSRSWGSPPCRYPTRHKAGAPLVLRGGEDG